MDILKQLAQDFSLKATQVENTVKLIDEGNTIPFIARYRKELTGSLDDQVLRELYDRLLYLRNLDEKREQYRESIREQEKLTPELEEKLNNAKTLAELEDIYLPYRPKRRTRATMAIERGLEPLAKVIFAQDIKEPVTDLALPFVCPEKDVNTVDDAINGALDIIAEYISDDGDIRGYVRKKTFDSGFITSKVKTPDAESVYEMYYDFTEKASQIAAHRVLAINRGEKEDVLSVSVETNSDEILAWIRNRLVKNNPHTLELMEKTILDSFKRLIFPSIERDIRNQLTETAEEGAIRLFGENLKQLLLTPPVKGKVVLALDPGFRTGCKVAVVDATGKVLDTGVIYPTPPKNQLAESAKILTSMIKAHNVDIISIGNGTASRETEAFAVDLIKDLSPKIGRDLFYTIVNEAGASVYSASKLGAQEFPQYDVALRSAVSIGRRLQDPLAELVKIEPKSIGVGQYQHDMNQKRLMGALSGVVENCVNSVGVDLNTASAPLLSYVSGISAGLAGSIVAYREENGPFTNRTGLKKVPKLGPKTFLQCAGFLRIPHGENPLDNTAVHPEAYSITKNLLKKLNCNLTESGATLPNLEESELKALAEELEVGLPTLRDILTELKKPGRDPRADLPAPILKSDVLAIEDLAEGMELMGTVRNIMDFGAFVDIGVHQDGLVHVSQLADKFVKHPLDVVKLGDIVRVRVLSVDAAKKRISLSMKGLN